MRHRFTARRGFYTLPIHMFPRQISKKIIYPTAMYPFKMSIVADPMLKSSRQNKILQKIYAG